MITKTQKSGYILVLSLMIVGAIMVLVTQLFRQGQTHMAFVHTMVEREKAKMLALSGIEIARCQLTIPKPKKEEKTKISTETKQKKVNPAHLFLQRVLPTINRWQTFTFKEKRDGMDGTIKMALSCEEGKLNINRLFDFEKKKFKGEGKLTGNMQDILKRLLEASKKFIKADLFCPLQTFLAKRERPLDDTTQLLSVPHFDQFKHTIFYQPITANKIQGNIFLTDIFTIWSDSAKLEPWLLSHSLCAILNLKVAAGDDIVNRKQQVELLTRNFKPKATWSNDWDVAFKELYGKTFSMLPQGFSSLLNSEFEPNTFGVLVQGTAGKVTQKVYAILKRNIDDSSSYYEEPEIIKLYWL